jgi:hypothetical protein
LGTEAILLSGASERLCKIQRNGAGSTEKALPAMLSQLSLFSLAALAIRSHSSSMGSVAMLA